jgi:hypothetical protein
MAFHWTSLITVTFSILITIRKNKPIKMASHRTSLITVTFSILITVTKKIKK